MGKHAKRAAQAAGAAAAGGDREGDGVLTITASKHMNKDPAQVAALAAAQNLITHGIGNASTDEQIALGYLQVNLHDPRKTRFD